MTVQLHDLLHMSIQIIGVHVGVGHALVKVRGVQVSALFDHDKLFNNSVRTGDPA